MAATLALVAPLAAAGELGDYLTGSLEPLELVDPPVSLASHEIVYPDGSTGPLADKRGRVLMVNLWARWCLPCKDEMKDLASLQRTLGDDRFEVVALPMKKRSLRSARKILESWGAPELQPYGNDPQALARVLYDGGMYEEKTISFVYPTTYIVDKAGRILLRHEGFLHWDTPEVHALIRALKDDRVELPADAERSFADKGR